MNLAEYITLNSPVVVYIRLSNGQTESAKVSSFSELPFDARVINDTPSSYIFVWDEIGSPLDFRGRRIVGITAIPQTERAGEESKVFP